VAVALAMALRRALSALPDPASVDDQVVVVGVTVDSDGAEGEAVNLHCRPQARAYSPCSPAATAGGSKF